MLDELIAVKGLKALGNRFCKEKIKEVNDITPEPEQDEKEENKQADENSSETSGDTDTAQPSLF